MLTSMALTVTILDFRDGSRRRHALLAVLFAWPINIMSQLPLQ
jgi:hypothetical protein